METSSPPLLPPPLALQPQPQAPPASTSTSTSTTATTPGEQAPVISPAKTPRPVPPKPYVENEPEPVLVPERVRLPESPKQVYARPAPTVEDGVDEDEEKREGECESGILQIPPDPPALASAHAEVPKPSSPAAVAAEISLPPSPPPIQQQRVPDPATPPEAATPPPPPPPPPSPTGPFIRPYDSTIDFYDCLEICHQTASPALQPLLHTPYKSLISSIYCKPYLLFSPSTAFILDCGSGSHSGSSPPVVPLYPLTSTTTTPPRPPGKAVGYILGPANTHDFIKIYQSDYLPLLDVHYPPPPPPQLLHTLGKNQWLLDTLFDPSSAMDLGPQILDAYPAHFRINVLPPWTRQGWGAALLSVWEDKVLAVALGAHVAVEGADETAWRWFVKMGFVEEKVVGREGTRWGVKRLG